MTGQTKIGIADVGGSFAMAQGWRFITDFVNAKEHYGFYTKGGGQPFYFDPTGELNDVSGSKQTNPTATIGDKVINAISGALDTFEQSLSNIIVEVGVSDTTVNLNSEITNAPVENGGFVSINKVNLPNQYTVNYIVTGTVKQRQYILNAAEKAKKSMTVFWLFNGEKTFESVNITGVSMSRNPCSLQLFNILIQAKEVINTAKINNPLSNATAYHRPTQNLGELEMQEASGSQEQAARKLP